MGEDVARRRRGLVISDEGVGLYEEKRESSRRWCFACVGSGSATSVTVTASYESAAFIFGDNDQTVVLQTATEPRLVTFDDAFSSATVPTLPRQVDYDTQRVGKAIESRGNRRLQSGNGFAAAEVQSVVATLVREDRPSDASPSAEPSPSSEVRR